MPIDLLAGTKQREPIDLLAEQMKPSKPSEPSWRKAPEPTMWERIKSVFPENTEAEAAKAQNALVYSEMFGIRPSTAYDYHDEISRQVQDKIASEKIVTEKRGMGEAFKSGVENAILGMMANKKVPAPFESVSQGEKWMQGMTSMVLDIPFFGAGYALGGGTPISGMAGSFGFHSGLRQMLVDRYTKGEVKNSADMFQRVANAAKETIKGEIVGGFTGGAGYMAPIWLKRIAPGAVPSLTAPFTAFNEIATMTTAGKLIEGHLPTASDFMDTAGILLAMRIGIKGYESGKGRVQEVKKKLQDSFIDSGAHPKVILDEITSNPPVVGEDIIDTIDRANKEIKANAPEGARAGFKALETPEAKGEENVQPAASKEPWEQTREEFVGDATSGITAPKAEAVNITGTGTTPELTSIKNAIVDTEREARGLESIETPVTARGENWREEVKRKVDSGEMNPDEAARKINNMIEIGEKPPAKYLTDEWNHAFEYRKKQLQNEYKITDNEARQLEIEELLDANEHATKATGTEQGRALQSRQEMMGEDYSLPAMLRRAREDGVDITPEIREKYKKLSKKIEMLETRIDEEEQTGIAKNVEKSIKQIKNEEELSQRKKKRESKKEELDVEFDDLISKLKDTLGDERGSFSWREKVDDPSVKILFDLTRNRIRKGLITAEEIVDSIHTALINAGIEMSKRDIRDAISGYGITKEMSKEEIAVKLREAKRQMQLISALEDAKAAEIPLRSGLQRDKPSDRVRELTREVQQAMRESGIQKGKTPEEQWKTSLDAVKTRLKNSIADLVKRLETGKKEPKKVGIEYDEQAKSLKVLRDKIQEVLNFVEGATGKRELSAEHKIKMATETVKKSIAEYERRLTEEDLKPKQKGALIETPELKRLRKERDFLKELYKMLKEEAAPKKTAEEIYYDTFKKRIEKRIFEYERRIKENDFSKKEKKPTPELRQQELELQYSLDAAKREYEKERVNDQLARRGYPAIAKDSVIELLNLVKVIKSSYDVSFPFRQGFFYIISHPIAGFKNIPEMFRALKSEEAMFRIQKELRDRENYKNGDYKISGLSLTETGGGGKTEEMYRGRWAQLIPGVPASERAFVSFANLARADLYDIMKKNNFENKTMTLADKKALGDYVNHATGRGTIKGYENALQGLGTLLWAPKLVLSRFQMVLGKGMMPGGGRTAASRRAVAKEYGRILTSLGIIYAVHTLITGETVELNPLSSDFGKIVVGNTRLDILAGVSQVTVFMSRIISGETKSVRTGAIRPIRGDYVPYGGTTTWGVITNFMRTKLTPALGVGINLLEGKDLIGEKVTLYDIPEQLIIPLPVQDIYEAMVEEGVPVGFALGMLGMFGVGIQTHEQKGAGKQ